MSKTARDMPKLYLVNVMSNFFAELEDTLLLRLFENILLRSFLGFLFCVQRGSQSWHTL